MFVVLFTKTTDIMKRKSLSFMAVLFGLILITSCGGKDGVNGNNCANNFTSEFQDDLNEVSSASTAYAMNPTPANCQAFKTAYLDYINALKNWRDCAIAGNVLDQYQQSLDAAEAAVNNISC